MLLMAAFFGCNPATGEREVKTKLTDGRTRIQHFDKDGKLAKEEFLKMGNSGDGLSNAEFRKYYPNGKLSMRGFLKNGLRDSVQQVFFANGQPEIDCYYLKDSLFGSQYTYDSATGLVCEYTFFMPPGDTVFHLLYDHFNNHISVKGTPIIRWGKHLLERQPTDTFSLLYYLAIPRFLRPDVRTEIKVPSPTDTIISKIYVPGYSGRTHIMIIPVYGESGSQRVIVHLKLYDTSTNQLILSEADTTNIVVK